MNQQPLSSTPSTSEPAPSTTAVSLHDTPNSPHSEHGPSARGGGTGGGGGPVANAATDAAVDIVAQLGGDEGDQNDIANAFGAAFREVGKPPSNQEEFGDWANEMSAAVAGQLQEQGQLPAGEEEAAKHRDAIFSSVIDHFQGVGGQQVQQPGAEQGPPAVGEQEREDYYTEQTLADPEMYGKQTEEEARRGVVEGQGLSGGAEPVPRRGRPLKGPPGE